MEDKNMYLSPVSDQKKPTFHVDNTIEKEKTVKPKRTIEDSYDKNYEKVKDTNLKEGIEDAYSKSHKEVKNVSFSSKNKVKISNNYIFTFGKEGSGKSTFHQHLLHWLFEVDTECDNRLIPVNDNYDAHGILSKWKERWRLNLFPERTSIRDEVKDFFVLMKPKRKRSKAINFAFKEIAGEYFHDIVPKHGKKPYLHKDLEGFLGDKKNNICFVLVCDGLRPNPIDKNIPSDDELFRGFLDYLIDNYPMGRFDRSHFLLLVSKWDKIEGDYSLEQYLDRFLPSTCRSLESRPSNRVLISDFSVGKVEEKEMKNEKDDTYDVLDSIEVINYDDIKSISSWIYTSFSGKRIRKKNLFSAIIHALGGK